MLTQTAKANKRSIYTFTGYTDIFTRPVILNLAYKISNIT